MKYNLPTREECQEILKKTDAFFVTETTIEGQKVEMYNYRLASLSDFVDNNAFELRGLTFVYDDETDTWERNILLQKFFNINQTDGWMQDDVKLKKILRVQNKEDGSIISFVKFKNGKVRAKSKMSFISEQAVMAQEVYDNSKVIRSLVSTIESDGFTAVFELVSPDNQIVLEYQETELKLLQIRNTDTGEYGSVELMDSYLNIWDLNHIKTEDFNDFQIENVSLQYLLDEKEDNQDAIEGWVVTFDCGQMAKIKTNKYLSLHGLIGPDAFRENLLVKTILDGNIDDVISALVPGVKKDRIIELDEKVTHHFNHLVVEFLDLRELYFDFFKEDRKEFALAKRTFRMFGGVMNSLKVQDEDLEKLAEKQVKLFIEKNCNGLGKAKEYLENL